MADLNALYTEQGQSPWLDNLRRDWLRDGTLKGMVESGIRGVTSNPAIFQKAMTSSDDYDVQLAELVGDGTSIEDSYWALVTSDIEDALAILRPVHDASGGEDGYVSVEVDPSLAHDAAGTAAAARELDRSIAEPNLYVKIPGTVEGLTAIREMIAEDVSVNVTLIFSLDRYRAVIEAYLAGLEDRVAQQGDDVDLSTVSSVASFFVSRVDAAVDDQLEKIGSAEAMAVHGRTAIANAKLAYEIFQQTFSGPRWEALAARGARVQRPLWASTSTKNPSFPSTLYVDSLIGPDTVNTLPDATIEAFVADGTIARTIDADVDDAHQVMAALSNLGVDLTAVTDELEADGVASFKAAFDDLLATLRERAAAL